jgi:FkbM family methyltransferase
MEYFSQALQDMFLDKHIFKGKENGFFIDIGAYDGKTFSNTLFFEKYRNWNGICIEPVPAIYEKLTKVRNTTCLNVCLSDKKGKVEFVWVDGQSEMLSGVKSNYDTRHLNRIEKETKGTDTKIRHIEVDSIIFRDLESYISTNIIDYLSIDVEGSELDVLKAINFQKYEINAITIEDNYGSNEIEEIMSMVMVIQKLVNLMQIIFILRRKNLTSF